MRISSRWAMLSIFAVALATTTLAFAQSYNISWYKIAGGGGTSAGGVYSVSGTIGQADAGTLSGGNYSLTGGFWSLIAVQIPGGPLLSLNLGTNKVILTWSSAYTGFAPQQVATLPSTNWTTVNTNTYPITTSNGTNQIVLPVSGNQFYRLYHP